ncbi:MAG: PA14 domain-containing protein, partial [Myxococcota bacterium]
DAPSARVHIVRGLEALAALADPEAADAETGLAAIPAAWSVDTAALVRRLGALRDADAAEAAPAPPPGANSPESADREAALAVRRALLADARALAQAVRAAEHSLYGEAMHRDDRRRLWRGVGLTLAILVPTIVGLVLTMPSYREGPWRGSYFHAKYFSGEPMVRRDADVRFTWDEAGPNRDFEVDAFSVRWETCMVLDRELEVAFRLTSDDGSRLYVDGERVINNWGVHGNRTRGKRAALEAGVHHVQVDYFDEKGDASVALVASLWGERPDQLPVRILHYPGPDEDDPCAEVRAELGL